jgi:hypothetical protein
MKTVLQTLVVILLLVAAAGTVRAADIQIIASKDVNVSEISAADLKQIFLQTQSSVGGAKVKPVLQKGGPAHEAFLKDYVGKSDDDLQQYYKTLVFSGKGIEPKTLPGDAAVINFVALSKGVIAYVSDSAILIGVNKIHVK